MANNPTTWVDPSGYSSALPTNLTPAQTAILVSLMVSLPALLLVPGGIGVPFLIFGLTIHCALVQGCLPRLKEMNKLIDTYGSSGVNKVEWTIATLNTAFAKYPLLPEASPAMQFMVGLGLGLLGLDTVTDFATLISGRDPITGHALTPQEMFVTWLAFSIPLVSAGFLRSFADDAVELLDISSSRYRIQYDYGMSAGEGATDEFGNIWISPHGNRTDRLRALYHEQVHAFLTPKGRFKSLRYITLNAYDSVHLWKYTEEALAESRALLKTGGKLSDGLLFPLNNGYVNPWRMLAEAGLITTTGYGLYTIWGEVEK